MQEDNSIGVGERVVIASIGAPGSEEESLTRHVGKVGVVRSEEAFTNTFSVLLDDGESINSLKGSCLEHEEEEEEEEELEL